MGNLLIPHGLLPRPVKRQTKPTQKGPPSSDKDPMPPVVGAHIATPHGTRRLQAKELARGLGVPTTTDSDKLTNTLLTRTTSVYIWEYLSTSLSPDAPTPTTEPGLFTSWDQLTDPVRPFSPPQQADPTSVMEFDWVPPDLSPGSVWHQTRVHNLRQACSHYPDFYESYLSDGLARLETHRGNYTNEGADAKKLQLLWWEFPPEHWDELREGCDMGFLSDPEPVIHANSDMDDEQKQVAAQFVEELIELGVLRPLRPGEVLRTNAPLFCVPKAGQAGQWRVIADCKAGGQNLHIGADPVYLNRPLHILEQMYSGGFSAVVDASKFFYQFPVRPEDQLAFGVVHPLTGEHYAYTGLPMGSGSSPGLAGRFGLSFVRMLREQGEMFTHSAHENCWWTSLTEEGYDPTLGYGFRLHSRDGSPAVKIWVHVDDFLIHGADLDSTTRALRFFLDKAVDVGLLCHPKKLHPPAQIQRYCGFDFDTTGPPTLRIPLDKLDRCRAMASYLGNLPEGAEISRLALSVIAGTLESVAEATPRRLGHTYLRATHSLIHPEGHEPGVEIYYSYGRVTKEVLNEMAWWNSLLDRPGGRVLRSDRSATLVPSWGDGSGTGTGGTIELPGQDMKLWMGQWSPTVYSHSSNWKELKTLLLTLQHLATLDGDPVRGATVFYFTDNSATYYVASAGSSTSPGLHDLVEKIQLLSLELGCFLQVVHVPGLVMIQQGTDGLSRGVWVSSYHHPVDHRLLNAAVFAPLRPDPELALRYVQTLGWADNWRLHHYRECWGQPLFNHMIVTFPPPEVARQCIIHILEAWVERPRTTSALLFVPRVLSGFWSGLSRHLRELDVIYPSRTPLRFPPTLPIPIVVLHLPPHSRSAPTVDRRDLRTPHVPGAREHRMLAEQVRGLHSDSS